MLSSFSRVVREGFGRLTACVRKDRKIIVDDGDTYVKAAMYTGPITYTEPTLYTGPTLYTEPTLYTKEVPRRGYRTTYEILRELNKDETLHFDNADDTQLAEETAKAKVLLQKLREERLRPKSFIDILEGR